MGKSNFLSSHLLSSSYHLAIRATISNHSVKKMPEIVEFFTKEFGNQYHLVFEPLVPLGRATINMSPLSEPRQDEFVDYYIQAKERGTKFGIEVRTSAANHRRLVTSFCGAMSIPSFTVTTKGVVTTCERDSEGTGYGYGKFLPESKDFVFDAQKIENNKTHLEIFANATLTFEENLIANDSDGCSRYGCTCIAYEKCCGYFIQ